MRRENTWPGVELYGPTPAQTWKALYDRFGLDFDKLARPLAARRLLAALPLLQRRLVLPRKPAGLRRPASSSWATEIRDNPPAELVCQEIYPWLDQITLPLVIHSFGGGRPGPDLAALDGSATCHYRAMPLLYAQESDHAVAVLEEVAKDKTGPPRACATGRR